MKRGEGLTENSRIEKKPRFVLFLFFFKFVTRTSTESAEDKCSLPQ